MKILGIDVSHATLAIAVWQDGQVHARDPLPNTETGWQQLYAQEAVSPEAISLVLEPSGGYELPLALWALRQGWTVYRPNPYHVRAWATSQGQRAKTDAQDAVLLARFGAANALSPWQPLPSEVGELEQLVQWREDLQAQVQQARNRLAQQRRHPHRHPAVLDGLERVIQTLTDELAAVDEAIAHHVDQQAELRQAHDLLRTVPGIGDRLAVTLLVTLWRWHVLTGGQGTSKGLTAYVGLDPTPQQSGTSIHRHAGISRQGNPQVRAQLYMGALGATRGDNPLQAFYGHLVAEGKAKKVALVAAARKLLTWAWMIFHTHTPFDSSRYAPMA